MSHFLDRLNFFKKVTDTFSGEHGVVTNEDRGWEDAYRARWQHDKIVRSTHGVNCTGSCSWKIYVKNGLVTWETQQTDYPRTRDDLPNHEPRGCQRGASYSWYLYSANRVKYPMIRGRLVKLWRTALAVHKDPVAAWASIVEDPAKAAEYKSQRGLGGFVRSTWDEVNPIIAAANVYTAKQYGPDRIYGFSPIPAMSMVSYAAGTRYLSLIGGACGSFYDWYCDLPPASPMVWGEQTDVPESADWYNSTFLMMWGSNVPQTRTPDAHFMTEVRYKGAKIAVVCPDYSEASKFADIWLHPKQGTDAAVAMAMGHVILREFYLDGKSEYFTDYVRTKTDFPYLVLLDPREDGTFVNGRFLRASDLAGGAGQANNPEWKTLAFDENSGHLLVPNGSIGFRWGEKEGMVGKWNLEPKEALSGAETQLRLSVNEIKDAVVPVGFPYFGSTKHPHFACTEHDAVQVRNVPAKKVKLADGSEALVATVYDLSLAQYGLDRGLGGDNVAKTYDDDVPYTPAWQEKITGVPRAQIVAVARQFAENADKTHGKSMIIIGAAMNHWYHMDMNYRGVINMLMMCGCVGQSRRRLVALRRSGEAAPANRLDGASVCPGLAPSAPAHELNLVLLHPQQPVALRKAGDDRDSVAAGRSATMAGDADRLQRAFSAHGLAADRAAFRRQSAAISRKPPSRRWPSAPNAYLAENLKAGKVNFAFEDPDNPVNFPRNMFVWRSNLLGSSGKGHEYFLKYLLGAVHGVQGKDLGEEGGEKPLEVKWRKGAEGKLDLLVTLDFRMSTTCLYSDIVLPTATWYEKNDLNTSDMHPFIHPLSAAVDPAWESRTDWDIFKGIAKTFSEVCVGHLGVEKDIIALPTQHDTPTELAMPDVKDWKKGECELIPGKTAPSLIVVERDYPNTYKKFTSVGPLLDKLGNGGKGISWNTEHEVEALATLNYTVLEEGVSKGRPRIDSDIDAAEMIMMLAPETNGHVAVKAWAALGKITGRDHTHLALPKEHEKIRFRDIQAQPRKIISSPTWSGLEDEKVSYNAGYTNVHELIPWRTVTGRQQFYQDHPWMLGFGEAMCAYRPPVDMKTVEPIIGKKPNGNKEIVLNFITPHQKWGIHSTYTDNLLMLTLSRGGPIIWMSEIDAKKAGIEDNDWIEAYNLNGAIAARAVVSQRVPEGMSMMYHAQEKIVNTPGSEITGTRGGIHNSVTRTVLKPTHMIGSYAQQSYGFNYYGTVGANRDEFIIVRKMAKIDWLDDETPADATVEAH